MPWTEHDAQQHTHKASTPRLRKLWAKIANRLLSRGASEARAIKTANAAVATAVESSNQKGT